MRPPETERILASIHRYLDAQALLEPPDRELTHEQIARSAGVAKRHLGRTDHGGFEAVRSRISVLKEPVERPSPELQSGAVRPVLAAPSTELDDLEADIGRRRRSISFRLRQWLAYHERDAPTVDAPLLLHDLDELVAWLARQCAEFRPRMEEAKKRRRAEMGLDS